ncbi:Uncharacterised protein [uncultured archaeon]|nr:Uncharacterised protein [uncultured archaeon]
MEQFEYARKKAMELFHQENYILADHTLERMIERDVYFEDIESVLRSGSFYKQELDKYGDIRYSMRGGDSENKSIRITFIVKENLIIITVIREQE